MRGDTVMLLIDVDNVSIDVIEQAVAWLHERYGGPHVRRAYGTAESVVKHQGVFKRLSIRPVVNLAAGKNSTDIALAVDAIDLVLTERPEVVAIASSDSDFAPLVSRLREKGCRVVGLGQAGKTSDETIAVYDEFEVLEHRRPRAVHPAPTAERTTGAKTTARAAGKTPAKKTATRRKAATPAKALAADVPAGAQAILDALPALARGDTVELRVAAERLREAGLLSRSGSLTKLFSQFPSLFELQPPKAPNHVKATAALVA